MGGSKEAKEDHPAQKPYEAMARPLRKHEGDVYEPFAGSGTTIIAAEQEGRRCYAIEIEPRRVLRLADDEAISGGDVGRARRSGGRSSPRARR